MVRDTLPVTELPDPWPGVRAHWRRMLSVPSTASVEVPGTRRQWHFLDNADDVAATGLPAAGTLLCVHGNPTWSYLWRSLLSGATSESTLAASGPWRVIAVDQLDMGFSERTGTVRRLEDRITDLGDLTDALDLSGPVITVGHDWGGVISLGWATRHRDLLAAVVLTNTAVHPAGFKLPAALKLALHPAVHTWGTKTSAAFLNVTHALAQPALSPEVRAAFMAPYQSALRRVGVGNFVADIPATEHHPSWAALETVSSDIRTLNVPVLMMWGPKDPIFSDRYLRDLLSRLPQADVHRFEGASHLLPEDRDIATPTFDWLAKNVHSAAVTSNAQSDPGHVSTNAQSHPGHVSTNAQSHPGHVSTNAQSLFRPMTAELDSRREDHSLAIVDMLPLGSLSTASEPDSDSPTELSQIAARSLSWAELARDIDDLAAGLADLGVKAGDRVSLLVPPGITLTTLIYACLRLSAVIVVADAGLGTKGMSRAIKGAGPAYLVGIEQALLGARAFNWPGIKISAGDFSAATAAVKSKLFNVVATVPELVSKGRALRSEEKVVAFAPATPDADAAVLFTSGSTGPAKGVVYTHRGLAAMCATIRATYNLSADTALVAGFAPFALLGPALGATSVTPAMDVTSPRTLTATALADAAAAIDATVIFASPAAMVNVVATEDQLTPAHLAVLSKVQLVLSAGAPLAEPLLAQVQELTPNASIHTPYGMTEALPITDISLEGIREAGAGNGVCVGLPVSGAAVAIAPLGEDGSVSAVPTTEPGVTGEILLNAPHVKERYDRLWITEALSNSIPGWHRSGDVGHLDVQGRLWVEGRLAHILTTSAGVRTPVAGEQAVERVASVSRAAVVGVGPAGTQAAVVIVETLPQAKHSGLADTELASQVRAAVRPVGLEVAAVLTINTMPTDVRHNSKIDRAKLAAWAARMLAGEKPGKP